MQNRRNLVEEILAVRGRRTSDFPQAELFQRLIFVEGAYRDRRPKDKEILRYFPIAITACMEGYFRLEIKQLIDSGEPYLTNSSELLTNGNVGFESLRGLYGQVITLGDIIAHSVPISSFSHVASHMSNLMGCDFPKVAARVHDRWAVEVKKEPKAPIITDAETTFRYVARTFELRHIFCHEFATDYEFDPDEIEKCFENSVVFLKAAGELVSQTLYPDAPLTQADMNETSADDYKKENERLEILLAEAFDLLSENQKVSFSKANEAWKLFFEESVKVEGLQYEEGTIRPTIENSAASKLTRERAKQVGALIESMRAP